MTRPRPLLILLLFILPGIACRAVARVLPGSGAQPASTATVVSSHQPTQPSCATEMGLILREANTEGLSLTRFPAVDTSEDIYVPLVTYKVNGDQLSHPVLQQVEPALLKYQQDYESQQAAWDLFTSLIPATQRKMLGQFEVMTDGPGGVLSAVEQSPHDASTWMLETDIADVADTKNLAFTLLHEFGHLLTLGAAQVPPNLQVFDHPRSTRVRERAMASCTTYFPGEGCSLPDSYVNLFYDRFWKDIDAQWSNIDRIEDDGRRDDRLQDFYRDHRTEFVDSYAVTSPAEDIAETWAFFVLSPRPPGDRVKDQKVQFFYEHPELVRLRTEILGGLCVANP